MIISRWVLNRAHQSTKQCLKWVESGHTTPIASLARNLAGDVFVNMSLRRSRKISPIAIEEGTAHDGERGLGEGCSRESISIHDDRTPLIIDAEHAGNGQRSSAAEQQDAMETTTTRPESRIGRRFMRYRNSWVGEDITLGTLRRVHARLDAVRSRITEEADESISIKH